MFVLPTNASDGLKQQEEIRDYEFFPVLVVLLLIYIRTPLIRINRDCGLSGYAEKPDNLIFF